MDRAVPRTSAIVLIVLWASPCTDRRYEASEKLETREGARGSNVFQFESTLYLVKHGETHVHLITQFMYFVNC
ncbi:hypothetical protein EYC84_010074 [Monilinia fructicola]|uniref:Secreted protein n=1 Tax=Monilinia fructicola TaxID=38448 RepID=A0A5M9JCI3_MONFR|nr:hypothetical protein EYC84_010074 [Monilinia fructicola]